MIEKIIEILHNGGIVVIPTDTIYGISARALDEEAVEKVHAIKDWNSQKPFIILISSIEDLKTFGVEPDNFTSEIISKYWPDKITIILDCSSDKFSYLHLGAKSLAFRIPDKKDLIELIKKTGPLVSTSANPENQKPASTISEAKKYFGNKVDFYSDEGEIVSPSSTLISLKDGKISVLRKGAVEVK